MGLAVAALSVTGIVIWYRKRIARLRRTTKAPAVGGKRNSQIPVSAE
jgi:hypothetical protein